MSTEKTVTLSDELLRRGYEARDLVLSGKKYRQYFKDGRLALVKGGHYLYPFISPYAKSICVHKTLSYAFAESEGVRVPATLSGDDLAAKTAFLAEHKRLIVKPSALGGGKGLTTGITTVGELETAIEKAARPGAPALVQEQFDAEEIRVVVIKGKVVSVFSRESPRVTGDGVATIAELIVRENEVRRTLVMPRFTYPQLTAELIPEDMLTSDRVPIGGERVRLAIASAAYRGASYYGLTNTIHPSFKRIAENLANKLNPPFLAVDFLVRDFAQPAEGDNYRFLEFTTSPSMYLFPSMREGGDQSHVITKIADLVDEYASLSHP